MRILLINLPPFLPKKPGNDLYYLQSSLNLGLLAVGSGADAVGHDVSVYDWLGPQQCDFEADFLSLVADIAPDVVGFSLPSGYGEPYLVNLSETARRGAPQSKIVVGGQYHAGFRAKELLAKAPALNAVICGNGDHVQWESLANNSGGSEAVTFKSGQLRTDLPQLNWDLHRLNLRGYAPSIEYGRGCPFRCSFCSLSGAPERMSRHAVAHVRNQLDFWVEYWRDLPRVPVYAECPVFFCAPNNIRDIEQCFSEHATRLEWRVQARVDSIAPEMFDELHDLGLRVIDLGLESASPRMLSEMQKTSNPHRYLERANAFIERAAAAGIGVKLNILLYPGETVRSAEETRAFVLAHKSRLAGIAAGSTLLFPGTTLGAELPRLSAQHGTSLVHDPLLADCGIHPLNLSDEFTYGQARAWCLSLSREVMTAEMYFQLKRVGYYTPSTTYSDMLAAASTADSDLLPFRFDGQMGRLPTAIIDQSCAEWDKLR